MLRSTTTPGLHLNPKWSQGKEDDSSSFDVIFCVLSLKSVLGASNFAFLSKISRWYIGVAMLALGAAW